MLAKNQRGLWQQGRGSCSGMCRLVTKTITMNYKQCKTEKLYEVYDFLLRKPLGKGEIWKTPENKSFDATLYGKSMICPKLMILSSYPVMDFIIILCRHWARLVLSIPRPNLSPKYTFFDWSTHTLTCKGIPLSPRTKSKSTISNKNFLLYFFRNENNYLFCYLFIIQPNCFLQLRVIP